MKKNKKGSALLWAVVLLLILDVVIAGALTISYAYYNRVFESNEQRQAYLTSKGIIEDIVEKIKAANSDYLALFENLEEGETNSITVNMPNASALGTSRAAIEKLNPKQTRGLLTIAVTTEYEGESDTVKADMQLGKVEGVLHWQLLRYYKGDPIPVLEGKNIVNAKKTLTEMETIYQYVLRFDMKGLNEYIYSDTEGYKNLMSQAPGWKPFGGFFDNTNIRNYLFYRNKPGTWIPFDNNEIKNEEVRKKLGNKEYFIQPYFPPSSYTECIVYANGGNAATSWMNVNLVYNEGHWYYIAPNSVKLSDFVDGASDTLVTLDVLKFSDQSGGNSSYDRWTRFKAKYLVKENRIQ